MGSGDGACAGLHVRISAAQHESSSIRRAADGGSCAGSGAPVARAAQVTNESPGASISISCFVCSFSSETSGNLTTDVQVASHALSFEGEVCSTTATRRSEGLGQSAGGEMSSMSFAPGRPR
jgi:hypothetical protein